MRKLFDKAIIICILVCVLGLAASCGKKEVNTTETSETTAQTETTTIETSETSAETSEETTTEETTPAVDDIVNIAFLGIDWQENRSDVMMIVSVNRVENKISVISLLRDSKVMIDGCSVPTKLGYAYKWGGPELALKTFNDNYGLDIEYYFCLWFEGMADVINSLGGVDIELSAEEAELVNSYSHALGYDEDDAVAGENHLNGEQAVSYSRIRKIDGEFQRSKRQQKVVAEMFRILTTMDRSEYPEFIKRAVSNMETNLPIEMIYSFTELDMDTLTLYETTVPDPDYETDLWSGWEDVDHTVEQYPDEPYLDPQCWFWVYDLDRAGERIRNLLN